VGKPLSKNKGTHMRTWCPNQLLQNFAGQCRQFYTQSVFI